MRCPREAVCRATLRATGATLYGPGVAMNRKLRMGSQVLSASNFPCQALAAKAGFGRFSPRALGEPIDAALEGIVERQRLAVGEGKELHHDHAGDAAGAVDPEIGVIDPAPAQA